MQARLGWLVAVVGAGVLALPANAQGGAKLAVGPDAGGYLCPDGRQLYVQSCYDDLPDANCGVLSLERWTTGTLRVQAQATKTRSDVQKEVSGCKLYPVAFDNGVVSLVLPKSALPQQTAKAPAASPAPKASTATPSQTSGDALDLTVPDGMAFGYTNMRSSLVRITPANATSRAVYVDEASRKVTAQKDVITIWSLTAYVDGKPPVAGDAAGWLEYRINCKESSFEATLYLSLDRQAKVLKVSAGNASGKLTKGSANEVIAGIACTPAQPFKGPRFPNAKAAIADAFAGAAPKTAAKPAAPAAQPNAAAQARQAFLEGERLWDEVGGDRDAVQQRKAAALAAFAKATKLDPTLRVAWLRQGEIYAEDIDSLDAVPFYEKAMELDPNDVETAEAICDQYLFAGLSPAKGIIACERLLKLNPFDPTFAHSAIAGFQQERGDNPKALVSALEWARLAPDDSYAWKTLSEIYVALGRNTDALAAVQKAVNLNSRDWSVLAQRGDVYRRLGKLNESIADYKAAIVIWPEGPQLHHGLADSLRAAGRKAEADAEKRLAIDHALSNGRNALKKTSDGSPVSLVSAEAFLGMLEKWDKSAAAKLAAEIKAAER